ncbi:hypothetical protein EMCRGX_G015321 [Ephydatia muelleri]
MGGYCLAHLFTYWVLSNGLLGLSNIASPSATTTGGICSTSFFSSSSGTRIIYNTALSSYTSSSNPLVFVEEVLVTGHEIGHSWGSYHDPATTPSCSNVFIMNQYAQDGSQPTHKMFSNCSRTSIGAVLSAKAQNCFTVRGTGTPAVLMPVSYAQRPCADLYLCSYTERINPVGWPTFNIHHCSIPSSPQSGQLKRTPLGVIEVYIPRWSAKVQVPGSVGTTWYGPGIGPTLMNNVAWTASHPPGDKLKWKAFVWSFNAY